MNTTCNKVFSRKKKMFLRFAEKKARRSFCCVRAKETSKKKIEQTSCTQMKSQKEDETEVRGVFQTCCLASKGATSPGVVFEGKRMYRCMQAVTDFLSVNIYATEEKVLRSGKFVSLPGALSLAVSWINAALVSTSFQHALIDWSIYTLYKIFFRVSHMKTNTKNDYAMKKTGIMPRFQHKTIRNFTNHCRMINCKARVLTLRKFVKVSFTLLPLLSRSTCL